MKLNKLELQVEELIERIQRLNAENGSLRKKLLQSNQEQNILRAQNKQIAIKIRQIVSRLKDVLP